MKMFGLATVILLVVAGAAVGIVLAIKKGGDDPAPSPPEPVAPGYNPYKVNESSIVTSKGMIQGVLQFD